MRWSDALIPNVDRTWRNLNLLAWHQDVWLIDHGSALYFQHNWATARRLAELARLFDELVR